MRQVQEISSVQNPRVKGLVKLRDQRGRRSTGRCIAEGHRAVARAVAAGLVIEEIWVCPELLGGDWPWPEGAAAIEVTPAVFRKVAYVRDSEGLLAVLRSPTWSAETLPSCAAGAMDLVAVGTEKPGNLGAMVRTADASGCRAVFAAGAEIDAMNPNAIRASTGCVFTMPTIAMTEVETLAHLKASGIRIIAAYPESRDAKDYTAINYQGNIAIVVGPEDTGLSESWRIGAQDTGGEVVRIPMMGLTADSLNASVAAAILLYEAARQRCANNA